MKHIVTEQALEAQSSARPTAAGLVGDPTLSAAYDSSGVDRSLIRWMLRLTPSERLRHVQGTIDLVHKARRVPDGDR
ncbi:MAG: hypothetical protein ABW061_23280 [Polyangiaceae bacterium]